MKKLQPRKLKPIQLLPKLKDLQKDDTVKKAVVITQDEHRVDFSSQTAQKGLLRKLLAEGNVGAFADLYNLYERNKDLSEQDMEIIRENLERVEEEIFAGKRLKAVRTLHDLASLYLEKDSKDIARYFFEKILGVSKQWGLEEGAPAQFAEAHVRAQLGYIRCLDFNVESDLALSLLHEASRNEKHREGVTQQLIELHSKMAELDEVRGDIDAALDHYNKSLEACKAAYNYDEEATTTLRVARLLAQIGNISRAIDLLHESLQSSHKLKKTKPLHHEIECHKQLAAAYEALNEWDDAETSYRSLNELLKQVHEERFVAYKSTSNAKLGLLHWRKNNNKDAIKYYEEYFAESLKARPKSWKLTNDARLTLGVAKGLDTFEDFAQYINMSRNKVTDMISFKKTGRIDTA